MLQIWKLESIATRPMADLGRRCSEGEARGEGKSCERQSRAEMRDGMR